MSIEPASAITHEPTSGRTFDPEAAKAQAELYSRAMTSADNGHPASTRYGTSMHEAIESLYSGAAGLPAPDASVTRFTQGSGPVFTGYCDLGK